MVTSWPGLPLRAISESMVLFQLGLVLMFMTCITTKGHVDVYDLGCHLKPCEWLRALLLLGTY